MYPHEDLQCSQDSIDAEGFRDACHEVARLAAALDLPDLGLTIAEVVDLAVARLPNPADMGDADPTALLTTYSEWLDSQGLVVSDQGPDADKRSHSDLAVEFLRGVR